MISLSKCRYGIQQAKRDLEVIKLTMGVQKTIQNLFEVYLWDLFMLIIKAVTNAYYRGANGCMLVYDISKEKTFHAV